MNSPELPARIDLEASVPVTVTFHDADPAGVAWHGNYFRYFELARCALLERIDYGYRTMMNGGLLWPIVQTEVKYIRALPFDSRITVTARLMEWEYRLKIAYEILDMEGRRATAAYTVQVAVDATTGEMHIGAPEILRQRLRAYLRGQEARP